MGGAFDGADIMWGKKWNRSLCEIRGEERRRYRTSLVHELEKKRLTTKRWSGEGGEKVTHRLSGKTWRKKKKRAAARFPFGRKGVRKKEGPPKLKRVKKREVWSACNSNGGGGKRDGKTGLGIFEDSKGGGGGLKKKGRGFGLLWEEKAEPRRQVFRKRDKELTGMGLI